MSCLHKSSLNRNYAEFGSNANANHCSVVNIKTVQFFGPLCCICESWQLTDWHQWQTKNNTHIQFLNLSTDSSQ